jgi:serine/threonine-protein kinase HipA
MSVACASCLADVPNADHDGESGRFQYHAACLRRLFGVARAPRIGIETAKLHSVALAMTGRSTLSGVQRKLSVGLDAEKTTLQVEVAGARYLLKPEAGAYPELPANEHLSTRIARAFGLATAENGLFPLADGTPAFVAKRFDRTDDGRKRRMEDFCQLSEVPAKEKYGSTAERCAKIVARFATEPRLETLALFRRFVFAYWTGDGDLHLKNLSLLADEEGRQTLAPAYDLVSTHLVIPDDPLALPIVGKKSGLKRATWLEFARRIDLPEKAAGRVLARPSAILSEAESHVDRSFLSAPFRAAYAALLRDRAASFVA